MANRAGAVFSSKRLPFKQEKKKKKRTKTASKQGALARLETEKHSITEENISDFLEVSQIFLCFFSLSLATR